MYSGRKIPWAAFFMRPDTLLPMLVLIYDALLYLYANHIGSSHADVEFLMALGSAKIDYMISAGEFWRLISAVFLHIAPLHLAINIIGLLYLTRFIQNSFSGTSAIIIFLFSGVSGVLASFIFNSRPSMGASGAVYGMAGAMLWHVFRDRHPGHFLWTTGLAVFLALSLLYDSQHNWVDLAAHIGGLAAGLGISPFIPVTHRQEAGPGIITVLLVIVVFSLFQAFRYESLRFNVPIGDIGTFTIDNTVLAWPQWWAPGRIQNDKCVKTKTGPVQDRPFIACFRGPMNALLVIGPTNQVTGMFNMPPPPNGVSISRSTKTGLMILMISVGDFSYILIARGLVIKKYYPLLYRLLRLSGPDSFMAPPA